MKKLPRLRLAYLPTPIEAMPRLSAALGGPPLTIKRDDQTGLGLGGNKTRKLEFLVAEAQANMARTLITAGAVQSNHCRQTAAAAARLGFDCILVLVGDENQSVSGNLLLDHLFGAEVVWTTREEREATLQKVFQKAWDEGRRPYLIPYGGSNATGAAAYAYVIKEILDQGYHPEWLVFASSSGGTQAGLVVGARLFGFAGKILGISVDEPAEVLQARVAGLATDTADFLGEPLRFRPDDILVKCDYLGDGYGVMGAVEAEAISLFARYEGLLLDPVYTGRAAAGLVDLVRQNFFDPKESVMFLHTGGSPALFAAAYQEKLAAV